MEIKRERERQSETNRQRVVEMDREIQSGGDG